MPRPLAFSCLSALLYFLAFPKVNFSLLAWVSLVPVLSVIQTQPQRGFFYGWLSGTLAHLGILFWVVVTFQAANQSLILAVLCLLLLSAYMGFYWGAWTWLLSRRSQASPIIFSLIAAAAWTSLELIRTHLFSGFPWALLGDSQWKHHAMIQIASLTGVYGVSFLVVLVNAALARWLPDWREPKAGRALLLHLGLVAVVGCWGFYRSREREMPPTTFPVALLQGSIDQYQKWDERYVNMIKRRYEALALEAARQKPALIVWPETSVPGYLFHEPELKAWLRDLVRKTKTPNLVGSPHLEPEKTAYNSAFLLNKEGDIIGQYDKQHLVPFGEIVPFKAVLGRWIGVLNELGGFAAGRRSPVMDSTIGRLGLNICYEAVFPNLVRQSVQRGAHYIVNITNDGWYMRTSAPYQHFVPNIFRAVENKRWVLRADNTGVSALIDPYGRITAASPIFEPLVLTGRVWPETELTFYSRFGNVFAWLCMAFCVGVFGRAILRR